MTEWGCSEWQNGFRITEFGPCHFECREESEIGDWWVCNDFRFFTPLRCVQNDREGVLRCVENDRGKRELRSE